ncbi:MAG: PilZ domain-containing protein [Myxococcota bacterium]
MFTPLHVLEQRRRLRRAVSLPCRILADDWDEPVEYDVRDLSPDGMFVETSLPLEPGTEMYVALSPPGAEVVVRAVVRRAELRRRRSEGRAAGMGIAFLGLPEDDTEALARALRGTPPPLPTGPRPAPRQVTTVWIDSIYRPTRPSP